MLRTGMLAHFLAELGHHVVWWNSDFDHHTKRHRIGKNASIILAPRLTLRLLHGCGYRNHISIARLRDHRQIAAAFLDQASNLPVPSAIVAGYPTIELAIACQRFAGPRGIPWALDIRDLWPDIFVDLVPTPLRRLAQVALRPYNRSASHALANADALIAITEPYLNWGLAKAGRKRRALDDVVPFGYPEMSLRDTSGFTDDPMLANLGLDPSRHLIIAFFGTFGRQFDIDTVIEAMKALQATKNGDADQVRFVLCGAGDNLDRFRHRAAGITQILFPGWLNGAQMRAIMANANLGLAPYFSNRNFIGNMPNKPIEYMSAGLPILTCLNGLLADTVRREKIGLVYRSGDPASLIEAIHFAQANQQHLKAMGLRANELFKLRYRSDLVMTNYHRFILHLAESGSKGTIATSL